MNPQIYLEKQLELLRTPSGITAESDLIQQIVRLVLSKKFRKYSANQELIQHVQEVVKYCVERQQPINLTFLHGAYKLWRLDEAPEVDWAELFALMYYTRYVKSICEIYKPGVWFDFFVDDWIIETIDNLSPGEVQSYIDSYQQLMNFLRQYQPHNLKMTVTPVSSQFTSRGAFDNALERNLVGLEIPALNEKEAKMVELNVRLRPNQDEDPQWREKIYRIHNAYLATKGEPGYHKNRPDKILVFNQPLPSGTVIALGTTKSSIAKFWVGVGALQPTDDTYKMIILSPSQVSSAKYTFQDVDLGLPGKNFRKIRVLE